MKGYIEYEYRATDGLLTAVGSNSRENYTQFNYSQAENKFSSHNSNGVVSTDSYDRLGGKTQISFPNATRFYITNYSRTI